MELHTIGIDLGNPVAAANGFLAAGSMDGCSPSQISSTWPWSGSLIVDKIGESRCDELFARVKPSC
jgi:hypothetical protein